MSHILERLDQSPLSAKSVKSEAYSNEPEGSQNGRPHFEQVPMRIVMIPVHKDVPRLVHNSRPNTTASATEMDGRIPLSLLHLEAMPKLLALRPSTRWKLAVPLGC